MTTPRDEHPSNGDGRHARRARGRAQVIDAMFDLINDGHTPLHIDQVAERAGISPASIYRYFGNLDEVQRHTLEHFTVRYADLLGPPPPADTTAERISSHVEHRVRLFTEAGSIMWLGRIRSHEHPRIAAGVRTVRGQLREHTARHFAAELATCADAESALDAIETITSPEAWNTLVTIFDRTTEAIALRWRNALWHLIDGTASHRPPSDWSTDATT